MKVSLFTVVQCPKWVNAYQKFLFREWTLIIWCRGRINVNIFMSGAHTLGTIILKWLFSPFQCQSSQSTSTHSTRMAPMPSHTRMEMMSHSMRVRPGNCTVSSKAATQKLLSRWSFCVYFLQLQWFSFWQLYAFIYIIVLIVYWCTCYVYLLSPVNSINKQSARKIETCKCYSFVQKRQQTWKK